MDAFLVGSLVLRTTNAIVWAVIVTLILARDRPVASLSRRMIGTVLLFGMTVLAIGSTTPFGFPTEVARLIATMFTAYALIVGLGILTTRGAL